jgi:hypothetical protein
MGSNNGYSIFGGKYNNYHVFPVAMSEENDETKI